MMGMQPLTLSEARQAAQQRMHQLPPPPRPFMMEEFPRDDEGDENDIISSSLLGTVSVPTALRNRLDLRSGKWTKEEEQFAFTIIQQFQNGTLQVPETSTLRQCLSVALNCDAMRISKKFAGPYSIGKQVFTPLDKGHANYAVLTAVAADELNIGRTSWFRKLDEIENQALSRSRKKMRLETKGTTAALIYSDHHTILRDKSETADLESFQSAIMSLHSMKQVHSSDRSASEHVRYPIQAANEDKLPSVVSAIEKILRGEFAQQAPVAHMTMAPMWVTQAPAPGYSPFMQQHSQEMQQHIMQQHMVQMQHPHMPQQYIQTGQTHPTETRNNDIPKFE